MKICYDQCYFDVGVVSQRNDVITFINFVRIARHQEIFSEIAQGSMYLLYLPQCWQSLNKFCESVIEIFGDEVSRVINTVNNILLR